MADPRPLFYVAAVVIASLLIWVIAVLMRPGLPWAEKKKVEGTRPEEGQPAA